MGKKPKNKTKPIDTDNESTEETLGQMKQRHKLELRNFQNELKTKMKTAKKEKDKQVRNQMEQELEQQQQELLERHQQELREAQAQSAEETENSATAEEAPEEMKNPDVDEDKDSTIPPKLLKAMRKRERKKAQEAERAARIAEESKNTVSGRDIENEVIFAKLAPLGLTIKEIPADGNCLYHAIVDQIKLHKFKPEEIWTYGKLRQIAAAYIREHKDTFLPFLALENDSDQSLDDFFQEYCNKVENTSEWGGQIELEALANSLQIPIDVFSASTALVQMGVEFAPLTPIRLSYHQQYYSLGEHYNSVHPMDT